MLPDWSGLITAAETEKPDLAILDVMLPDGDGFSLMEQIRTWTDIPVIFLTARDEAADKLAGLQINHPLRNTLNLEIHHLKTQK